jgi:tetratricopeptide (TPR) repeat protein
LVFWPANLSIIYSVFDVDRFTVMRAAIMLVAIALGFRFLGRRGLGLFALFAFVFLLPVLQIFPRGNYLNDRYLYLPLIGIAAFFLAGLETVLKTKTRPIWFGISAALILILPVSTFGRSAVWVSDLTLWTDTVQKNSASALGHLNLGMAYQSRQDFQNAVDEFQKAASLGEGTRVAPLAYNDLGVIFARPNSGLFRNLKSAEIMFRESVATSTRPDDGFEARVNLGALFIETGRKEDAEIALVAVINEIRASADGASYEDLAETAQKLLNLAGQARVK